MVKSEKKKKEKKKEQLCFQDNEAMKYKEQIISMFGQGSPRSSLLLIQSKVRKSIAVHTRKSLMPF